MLLFRGVCVGVMRGQVYTLLWDFIFRHVAVPRCLFVYCLIWEFVVRLGDVPRCLLVCCLGKVLLDLGNSFLDMLLFRGVCLCVGWVGVSLIRVFVFSHVVVPRCLSVCDAWARFVLAL